MNLSLNLASSESYYFSRASSQAIISVGFFNTGKSCKIGSNPSINSGQAIVSWAEPALSFPREGILFWGLIFGYFCLR